MKNKSIVLASLIFFYFFAFLSYSNAEEYTFKKISYSLIDWQLSYPVPGVVSAPYILSLHISVSTGHSKEELRDFIKGIVNYRLDPRKHNEVPITAPEYAESISSFQSMGSRIHSRGFMKKFGNFLFKTGLFPNGGVVLSLYDKTIEEAGYVFSNSFANYSLICQVKAPSFYLKSDILKDFTPLSKIDEILSGNIIVAWNPNYGGQNPKIKPTHEEIKWAWEYSQMLLLSSGRIKDEVIASIISKKNNISKETPLDAYMKVQKYNGDL